MVTTTGTNQDVAVLLEETMVGLKKLMGETEFREEEMREAVLKGLSLAFQIVVPTVKLIDKEFGGYEGPPRGIFLARIGRYGVYLTRQGMVHWVDRTPYSRTVQGFVSALDEKFKGNTYELIQSSIGIMRSLRDQYTLAVRGNEGRHRWLTATNDRLARALRPFEPTKEVRQISIPPYE